MELNKIYNGDVITELNKFNNDCVDLVVTSPPYNLKNSTGNGMKDGRGGKWSNAELINGYADHDDNLPHHVYVDWQRECISEMLRVTKDTGAVFYNHKWRVQKGLLQDRNDIVSGFPVRQIIIWQRSGGMNFNKGYFLPTYEVIYVIAKPKFQLRAKANVLGDIWKINQSRGINHPAPFPVDIPKRIIQSTFTDIVLDPFMGSGSTAVAAIHEGVNYIGIEKSQKYIDLAYERIGRSLK